MLLDCINTAVRQRSEGFTVDEIIEKLNTYSQKLFEAGNENGSYAVDGAVRFLLSPEPTVNITVKENVL